MRQNYARAVYWACRGEQAEPTRGVRVSKFLDSLATSHLDEFLSIFKSGQLHGSSSFFHPRLSAGSSVLAGGSGVPAGSSFAGGAAVYSTSSLAAGKIVVTDPSGSDFLLPEGIASGRLFFYAALAQLRRQRNQKEVHDVFALLLDGSCPTQLIYPTIKHDLAPSLKLLDSSQILALIGFLERRKLLRVSGGEDLLHLLRTALAAAMLNRPAAKEEEEE